MWERASKSVGLSYFSVSEPKPAVATQRATTSMCASRGRSTWETDPSLSGRCDKMTGAIGKRHRAGIAPPLCENRSVRFLQLPNGARMTTHITIEFTEHAAETIGEQTSTSFSYDQGAHVPQPGDFVEIENSRQTFLVIGRVFSLKANYSAVKLVLDLPPHDDEQGFPAQ